MDENNIELQREDLTEEFYSLAQTHSEEVKKLLKEFEDEQLQLALNLERYEQKRTQETNLEDQGRMEDELGEDIVEVQNWLDAEINVHEA